MLPDPKAPPALGLLPPQPWVEQRVCGHRYQEGGPGVGAILDMCSCGTFAIGRCSECGSSVCGLHSALRADRRLCLEHAAAEDTAAKDAAAGAKRVSVWNAWSQRLERLCEGLATLSNPADRALGAIVNRPRLFADPPTLAGRPTGELDALPRAMRRAVVEDYRTAIETLRPPLSN